MPEPSASKERPLYLVGMMGAGKSTVGPLLAARLGRPFVDTDQDVEARAGKSIPEIFESQGEARFRELEAEAIERASQEGAVVALGGGAIAQPGMADHLCATGLLVWLKASAEVVLSRIGDGSGRPLLAGLDTEGQLAQIRRLLEERRTHYERAHLAVDASAATERVVDEIVAGMKEDEALRRGDGRG